MFPRILLIPASSSSSSLLFHPFRLYACIHMRTALNNDNNNSNSIDKKQSWSTRSFFNPAPVLLTLAVVLSPPRPSPDAFSNVPQTLSGNKWMNEWMNKLAGNSSESDWSRRTCATYMQGMTPGELGSSGPSRGRRSPARPSASAPAFVVAPDPPAKAHSTSGGIIDWLLFLNFGSIHACPVQNDWYERHVKLINLQLQ